MVLIFDLDDTLYAERTYVESGLRAVARFGEREFGWDADVSFRFMVGILDRMGRGKIFDLWLKEFGRGGSGLTHKCVNVYRRHTPILALCKSAQDLLPNLRRYPLYIVTDGHKLVQAKKVQALRIAALFRHVYITHRYGLRKAKPSTYCFELIKRRERCAWPDLMYVGDNPAKDFVNLNRLGVKTVRVLTGAHRHVQAAPGYEAQFTIPHLGHLPACLKKSAPKKQTP